MPDVLLLYSISMQWMVDTRCGCCIAFTKTLGLNNSNANILLKKCQPWWFFPADGRSGLLIAEGTRWNDLT